MNTLIGAGAELSGDFTLDGSARIDGKIGGNVTVTGNLILGAGSVVTKDIPSDVVAVGNPCKVLRKVGEKDREFYFKNRRIDYSVIENDLE